MEVEEEDFESGFVGVGFQDDDEWFAAENPMEWENEPDDSIPWDGTLEIMGRRLTKWDIALSCIAAVIFLLTLLVLINCLYC